MKACLRRVWPLVLLAFAGCDSTSPEIAGTAAAGDSVALFQEGKGVPFTEETRTLFGLEIAEVAEKPMRRQWEKTAEVYRTPRGTSPGGAVAWCSETDAKALVPGQVVSLRGGNESGIAGRLVRLDRQAHMGLGQVEALIEFNDARPNMTPGAFVTATFTDDAAHTLLTVPTSAVLETADGRYVYTVNGSHLTRTRVKVGPTSEGFTGIEEGLYAGDAVAAKGVDELWLVELSALKGGTPCCPAPKKESAK